MLSVINVLASFFVVASTLLGGSYVKTTDATYDVIYSSSVESLTVDENGYLYNPTSSTITGYVLDSSNSREYVVRWQAFSYSQVADYNSGSYSTTYVDYLLLYDSGNIDVGVGSNYYYYLILLVICGGVIIICMRN